MDERQLMNENEVVSVQEEDLIIISHPTFKIDELKQKFISYLISNLRQPSEKIRKWYFTGVDCEVLTPHQGWRKGKIKFCLEFSPDEPESLLDDICHSMNENEI